MTVKSAVTKITNLFKFIISLLILLIIRLRKNEILPSTFLIIRLDAIGDYVLFRNFLEVVRNSERFGKYNITLCGNIIWRDLAEKLDSEFVDTFIWIDRRKFSNSFFYRYKILKSIYIMGFETAVDTTYSREILFGDSIIRASSAKLRIGSSGALDKHAKWKRNLLTDKYYTKLINTTKDNIFEFYRNKEFFEKLLDKPLQLTKPGIETDKIKYKSPTEKYVVIVPGAAIENRRWDVNNFGMLSSYIIRQFGFDIVLTGSESERAICGNLRKIINGENVFNVCSAISLPELVKLIANAEFLISNETGPVHIAVAVSTPFICISNGNHFGRFSPYPREVFDKGLYVYPPELMSRIEQSVKSLYESEYRYESRLDINSIDVASVYLTLNKLLKINSGIARKFQNNLGKKAH